MENKTTEAERNKLKQLLAMPSEQHPEFSVDKLMQDYHAFSILLRNAYQQASETPEI